MNENISNALACTYVDAKKIILIKNFAANFVYFVLIEVILASFRPQSKYWEIVINTQQASQSVSQGYLPSHQPSHLLLLSHWSDEEHLRPGLSRDWWEPTPQYLNHKFCLISQYLKC